MRGAGRPDLRDVRAALPPDGRGAASGDPMRPFFRSSRPGELPQHLADDVDVGDGDGVVGIVGVGGDEPKRRRAGVGHELDALDHEPGAVPEHEELAGGGDAARGVDDDAVAVAHLGLHGVPAHANDVRGVEVGAGIRCAGSGITVEGSVRGFVAHEASGYEERSAGGSVRIDSGASRQGLWPTLSPAYGDASSGTERLWSVGDAAALAPDGAFEAKTRFEAELGYGLATFGGHFIDMPNVGFGLSDTARDWRIGWRLTPAPRR